LWRKFNWAQSWLAKLVNTFKAKVKRDPKFKFWIQVPCNPHHAMELDIMNRTNALEESMGIELGQINEYKTFHMLEDSAFLPDTYKKIPYHMVLDV
jgi:hypothetical protein